MSTQIECFKEKEIKSANTQLNWWTLYVHTFIIFISLTKSLNMEIMTVLIKE